MTTENEESSVKQYQRYCEGGCGYKLPWEYKADELYCNWRRKFIDRQRD